jgi:hypothetical protein
MRLFSYILPIDAAFAPNPFYGFCTLACCKPKIRRAALPGDWIVGLSPKRCGNRIVYAMKVAEKVTFDAYWRDPRFTMKVPDLGARDLKRHCGDNLYEQSGSKYLQHAGAHSIEHAATDLSGVYVLVATDFVYFGANAISLPPQFTSIVATRSHRSNFPPALVHEFAAYIASTGFGVHGLPTLWPPSWSRSCGDGGTKDGSDDMVASIGRGRDECR